MRKIGVICAMACYIIAFNTNRPCYDYFNQDIETAIHAVVNNHYELRTKVNILSLSHPLHSVNTTEENGKNKEVIKVKEIKIKPTYSEKDLYLYANVVDSEAGSSWLCDEHQQLVVCVLRNRIKSNKFPNTLHDVIYQKKPIQYESAWNGSLNKTPSDRAVKNVKAVLDGKYTCPEGVIFQSEHIQGRVYKQFYNKYTGTTTYFCYSNNA